MNEWISGGVPSTLDWLNMKEYVACLKPAWLEWLEPRGIYRGRGGATLDKEQLLVYSQANCCYTPPLGSHSVYAPVRTWHGFVII